MGRRASTSPSDAANYPEAYGIYACNGILFNHESPTRGETFVTRKITRAMARIALGLQDCLHLGNLSALRDWGHARDYVEMMWLMLQQQQAEDFVIATGIQVSVREFVQRAATELGITVAFSGEDVHEIGTVAAVGGDKASCKVGDVIVRVDPRYFRPTEVQTLLGDPGKARTQLGWTPATTLAELVREMVESDYVAAKRDSLVKQAGFQAFDYHE
jgi:GDPmannose 4,6-dehydratase